MSFYSKYGLLDIRNDVLWTYFEGVCGKNEKSIGIKIKFQFVFSIIRLK